MFLSFLLLILDLICIPSLLFPATSYGGQRLLFVNLSVWLSLFPSVYLWVCHPARPAVRPDGSNCVIFLPVSEAVVCVANRAVPVRSSVLNL